MSDYHRIRCKDNLSSTTCLTTQTISSRGCPTGTEVETVNWSSEKTYKTGRYVSMSDVVTPGFSKASKQGLRFFKPMTRIEYEIDGGYGAGGDYILTKSNSCSANPYYPGTKRTITNGTFGRTIPPYKFAPSISPSGVIAPLPRVIPWEKVESLIAEASTAARNDRGRGNSNANQWETLAELHKSFGMFGQAVQNANDFVKKNSSKLKRAKATANAYLLYRYGFVPVMMAVEDATHALSRAVGEVEQTSRGSASMNDNSSETKHHEFFAIWQTDYTVQKTETVTVRSMFLDRYESTLMSNSGLGFKNLATLPWELVPYSFVIDWVTNIGDYIGSLIPTFGLTPLGSCTVIERNTQYKISSGSISLISLTQYWNDVQQGFPPHGFTVRSVVKDRIPGVSEPSLVIRSNFKLDSWTRALDSVSLLTQKLRK